MTSKHEHFHNREVNKKPDTKTFEIGPQTEPVHHRVLIKLH